MKESSQNPEYSVFSQQAEEAEGYIAEIDAQIVEARTHIAEIEADRQRESNYDSDLGLKSEEEQQKTLSMIQETEAHILKLEEIRAKAVKVVEGFRRVDQRGRNVLRDLAGDEKIN